MNNDTRGLDGDWNLFTNDNSPLPSDYILAPFTAVYEDRIWINVWISQGLGIPAKQHGLVLTNGIEWYEYQFGKHGLPARATEYMATGEDNILCLSVPFIGICYFNGKSTILYRFGHAGLPELALIRGIHVDSEQTFVATTDGVYTFIQGRWERVSLSPTDSTGCVTIFGVDQKGHLWFACQTLTDAHFFAKRADSLEFVCSLPLGYKQDEIVCFTVDAYERIWLGRRSGGLMLWEREEWNRLSKQDCSLLYGEIQDLTIDEFHNLWVGTARGYAIFDGQHWHDWGAIRLSSQVRPVSRDVLLSVDSSIVSEHIYIGGWVAIDSIGRKWLSSTKGLVVFMPYDIQKDEPDNSK